MNPLGAALLTLCAVTTSAQPGAGTDLDRAAGYVARFHEVFASVLWRERYIQERRLPRRFASSGLTVMRLDQRRVLDSELLYLRVPSSDTWVSVRDVISVDGRPRSLTERKVPTVMRGAAISVDQLRHLAAANGQFNIGSIRRTFNEPTLALLFLDAAYRRRFSFTRSGTALIDGVSATAYEFAERGRPTVIQSGDRDVPARGRLWIDATTGRVLQTRLELTDPAGDVRGVMTTRYRPNAKLDVMVPIEMRERYTAASGEELTTLATYSDFRRFETAGRLILPR